MEKTSKLIVLTGKTASGKDTVMRKILSRSPHITRVVTTTSRPPRNGEINGQDYNFISREDFNRKAENGDFIEYVEYGGNFYGTEKKEISNASGKDIIWRIDPSRAGQIRDFIQSAYSPKQAEALLQKVVVIFINTDNQTILERLKRRGISGGEIQRRMEQDSEFYQNYKQNYDFIVENVPGKLDETIDKVVQIINNVKS